MQGIHRSFLSYKNAVYGKAAAAISIFAIILYLLDRPDGPPNGGTLLGYTYGTLGFLLIAWLAWFGIRRRRYGGTGSLENLLSAHVYFGTALVVVATLHMGFQLHWNVHGLAYILMLAVIGSGLFGAYAFWRYPKLMTANRSGETLAKLCASLAALDLRCQNLALSFPDEIAAAVAVSSARPANQSTLPDRRLTLAAIARVEQQLGQLGGAAPADVLSLVQALTQRLAVLDTLVRDRRYRALMLLWRAVHVPITLGLLVALAIHVFAVFYNW
jgi:hypothetical protein